MSSTRALTPIAGTNGYQQQVAIDPNRPLHLSVSNASGEIRIAGSDQAGVWVVVRRSNGDGGHDPDIIPVSVDVDPEGNQISIHPDWGVAGGVTALARKIKDQLQNGLNPNDWDLASFRLQPDLNYDIRVEIPRSLAEGSKVVAKTASGELTVSDVDATLVAATASGRVTLNKVRGKIVTNTASGAIVIDNAHGSLEANTASGSLTVNGGAAWTALRTVSGRISVERFTMKNARVATVSGSIGIQATADNAQEYAISSVSGSVKLDLTVPAASVTSLTSRSASGSVKVGDEWVEGGRRRWTVGAGEPGPAFNVKTVSGSLKASARTDAKVMARNEPLPTVLDDEGAEDATAARERRDHDAGFDHEVNIDGMTAWAREFAQDFKKNFASLATPPAPPEAPAPPAAARPVTPAPAPAPAAGATNETAPVPSQPWTWSSGSGSTPPTGPAPAPSGQETAPLAATTSPPTATALDPSAETPPAGETDAERLRVLEALERGEIDIDEALARLDPDDTRSA